MNFTVKKRNNPYIVDIMFKNEFKLEYYQHPPYLDDDAKAYITNNKYTFNAKKE